MLIRSPAARLRVIEAQTERLEKAEFLRTLNSVECSTFANLADMGILEDPGREVRARAHRAGIRVLAEDVVWELPAEAEPDTRFQAYLLALDAEIRAASE